MKINVVNNWSTMKIIVVNNEMQYLTPMKK